MTDTQKLLRDLSRERAAHTDCIIRRLRGAKTATDNRCGLCRLSDLVLAGGPKFVLDRASDSFMWPKLPILPKR